MQQKQLHGKRRGDNKLAPYRSDTQILLGAMLSTAGLSKRQFDIVCRTVTHTRFKTEDVIQFKYEIVFFWSAIQRVLTYA